jgi:hypothetical protein
MAVKGGLTVGALVPAAPLVGAVVAAVVAVAAAVVTVAAALAAAAGVSVTGKPTTPVGGGVSDATIAVGAAAVGATVAGAAQPATKTKMIKKLSDWIRRVRVMALLSYEHDLPRLGVPYGR